MNKFILLPALSIFSLMVWSASCQTQPKKNEPYKIEFTVKGWKDTTAYLGYYYGESTFLHDTAKVDSRGHFVFQNKKELPQGVYILVLNKRKILDFVISTNRQFSFETDSTDYIGKLSVKNDLDNELFFDNLRYNGKMRAEADPYIKVLQDSLLKDDAKKKEAMAQYNKIGEKVFAYQKGVIEKHPETLTARILKTSQQIHIPDPPKLANGKVDSLFQYKYYKQHYWDNFNVADDALLRLPSNDYAKHVERYLDQLFPVNADSVMTGIDYLVKKAKPNKETYKFMVWTCLNHYVQPKYMGMDAVYFKVYDKYIATGEMDYWLKEKNKKSVKELADKYRLANIGMVAPNLKMQDQNLQPKSLYDLKAKYVAILFFDHNCGHCRTETPKLVEQYNRARMKLNFDIFAVDIDTNLVKMKEFIKEFKTTWTTVNGPRTYLDSSWKSYQHDTTPFMYVMDNRTKKVIARKLPVESLEEFLTNYEKSENRKKTGGAKNSTGTP